MAHHPLAALALALLPVALLYRVGRRVNAPPSNDPRAFLARGGRRSGERVCACVGASIVHGRISVDFVEMLRGRLGPEGFVFVNAGVNGDLAYNARQRLPDVIACQPDVVVVLVGTNDVLATLSPRHEARYRRWKGLPVAPTRAWYRENLAGIVASLRRETQARVALCSLPVLGEDLASRTNQLVAAYSETIREVAAAEGAAYVPVREAMVDALRSLGGAGRAYGGGSWPMSAAMLRRHALGIDFDTIAAGNGYRLLTEGIHLSSRGARIVADEVERFVRDAGQG